MEMISKFEFLRLTPLYGAVNSGTSNHMDALYQNVSDVGVLIHIERFRANFLLVASCECCMRESRRK